MEVVKIKNPDFSYWAWSTPWGHVLSLKSFCQNPVRKGKTLLLKWLKNNLLYPNLTTKCQKVKKMMGSGPDFNKYFLDQVYFKPSRKNQDFLFLPLPSNWGASKVQHFQADSEYLGEINTKQNLLIFFFNV